MEEVEVSAESLEILDRIPDFDFFKEFMGFFGALRAVTIAGWVVAFGVVGIENKRAFQDALIARGVHRATLYRVSADLRRFRQHLLDRYRVKLTDDGVVALVSRLSVCSQ